MSLPSRERELKLVGYLSKETRMLSLPSRERELKPLQQQQQGMKFGRSPRGSAN